MLVMFEILIPIFDISTKTRDILNGMFINLIQIFESLIKMLDMFTKLLDILTKMLEMYYKI